MKYLDGILRPGTIRTGVYSHDGLAYFTIGNFVSIIFSSHEADLMHLTLVMEGGYER